MIYSFARVGAVVTIVYSGRVTMLVRECGITFSRRSVASNCFDVRPRIKSCDAQWRQRAASDPKQP